MAEEERRLRLFVAVDPEARARERLGAVQGALRTAVVAAGWRASFPSPDHLHLTLRFLGSLEAARVPALAQALAEIGAVARFEIAFGGLGSFPEGSRPRVLWVGLTAGGDQMKSLAERVGRSLEACGLGREARPFRPHLTLARVRHARGQAAPVLENVSPKEAGSSLVTEVMLYRSELGRGGSRYTPLVRIPLAER